MLLSFTRKKLPVLILSALFISLTNCEVNGGKREVPTDDSVILSYFFSDQYASESEIVQTLFPLFSGAFIAADPNGKFELWKNPPTQNGNNCLYASNYQDAVNRSVGLRRALDVGDIGLRLNGADLLPLTQSSGNSYFTYTPIDTGHYELVSPGLKNGALKHEASFSVPSKNSAVAVFDLSDEDDPGQPLVSPEVPMESDRITFDTNKTLAMAFASETPVDYVRVLFDDGSNTAEGQIVCFSEVDETLFLHQGYFSTFRTGEQGFLQVDFVNIHKAPEDTPRLKEGVIISSMRHIMGTIEYKDEQGSKITDNLGVIEFR